MQIENDNKTDNISKPDSQKVETLQSLVDKITDKLKTGIELKKQTDFTQIANHLKRIYVKLSTRSLSEYLSISNSIYGALLNTTLINQDSNFPCPKTEQEIVQVLLVGLVYYKERQYQNSGIILNSLLFESPHDLATRIYLIPLSSYILYKFLNTIEKEGKFADLKEKIYHWLALFQNGSYEALFSTVYVFLLRNLLKSGQLKETTQLLKNCRFPEHIGHSLLAKFLFYKGVYLSRVGQLTPALNFITESLRKASEDTTKKGLNAFKSSAQKLKIVLQLLVNDPISHQWLNENKIPVHYMSLVGAVNRGDNMQFHEVINTHKSSFEKDDVMRLLDDMRSVVTKNALKKLSISYSKISIKDALAKLGVGNNPDFDLNAFLTKSREDLPEFTIDHKNLSIEFTQKSDNYYSSQTRESLIRRIRHLQGLEEQVNKSLKFKVQLKEVANDEKVEDSEEDDDHFSDYSGNEMDM